MGTHPAEDRAERLLGGSLAVLRQLRDGVVLLALGPDAVAGDFEVLMANDAALELYALRRSDLTGRGHDLMRTSGLDEAAAREITAALAAGEPATVTALVSRADGARLWVNIELTPLQTPEPGAGLWIAVSRDISSQVENAQLEQVRLDIERRARLALSIVARVSDILQEPDSADVLRAIADLVTPQVVAWSGFFVLGRDLEEVEGIVDRPDHRSRLPRHAADPAGDLLREPVMRTVRLEPGTTPEPGTVTARLYELLEPRFAQAPGAEGSVLVLPVLGRVRTLGLFVALPYQGATSARIDGPLGQPGTESIAILPDEVGTVLELVARRVGMAMDNAQLYAREHLLAETLQRAMLPEQADVPDLDVWTYYAPNVEHAQVGGDWYDVVNLGADTAAVVVGDVVGHDVEAAAAMGQLRSVVRAYAQELIDPAMVLSRVDSLVTGMRIPRTASLVYATLTRRDGSWTLRYSRAGHLPALLRRDGKVEALDAAGGQLVGFDGSERETALHTLLPGDVLVLYTDGLVERRDRSMRRGLEELVRLTESIRGPDAAGIGEELLQLADAPEDDIAVVVIRVPGGEGAESQDAPRRRRWQIPADPSAISRARQEVRQACEVWQVSDAAAAELVVSELVSNAVMHGRGQIGLRLQALGDGGLRIEVEDGNPAPPVTREQHTSRVGGYGMHIVDRLADWGWRPTPGGKVVWARMRHHAAPWAVGD
ncbi:ATP-binding SpoIIE family protein phosphatase [Georgenia deserti]|uniref:SpoIIE family protein phosphatase n=1 Tax=Georgenia deserti TaxID=2093781 RepID=A0ABW4KXW7_9MICO